MDAYFPETSFHIIFFLLFAVSTSKLIGWYDYNCIGFEVAI